MGRGNWWMLASPVQVPRKGKGDMEGLSPALQASTGGYRSILEQADQSMYVAYRSYAQYREPQPLPSKKHLLAETIFFNLYSTH